MGVIEKIFGTHSDRELKLVNPIVDKIESLRSAMQELSDEQLRDKTKEFKKRREEGETLEHATGGSQTLDRFRALSRAAGGRRGTASGTNRGDEDR